MRIPVLLAAASFALAGCQFQSGITTITNASIDGHGVNATRSYISDGAGEFECIKSASGHCYYLLFVERCPATKAEASKQEKDAHARCDARVVATFALDAGGSKRITGLPARVRQCVRHDAAPATADCLQPNS